MQKKQEQERKEFVKPVITSSGEDYLETVVLLFQQKPDDTIEIDLGLDELDATSAETKATYQEIKDYGCFKSSVIRLLSSEKWDRMRSEGCLLMP